MPTTLVRLAALGAALGLLASCGGGRPDADPEPSGPSLIVRGDALCADLFTRNAEYLAGDDINADAYVAVGDRLMQSFRPLVPPAGDDRWTDALAARWEAVRKARGIEGDLSGALWQFIGPARVAGLWLCGPEPDRDLEEAIAKASFASTIEPAEYARRLDAVIGTYAPKHEDYHHEPDPAEVAKRLNPGDSESHGPGYLEIQRAMIAEMGALPAPEGQQGHAAAFLHFMRRALAAETEGIRVGGTRGEALFEPSYAETWQAVGIACVTWGLDLCD